MACTLFTGLTNGIGLGLVMRTAAIQEVQISLRRFLRYTPLGNGKRPFVLDGTNIISSNFIFE